MARESGEKRPIIATFGLFGSQNFGNEATLASFLLNVTDRLPNARFVGIVPHQTDLARREFATVVPLDPLPVQQYFWRMRPRRLRRFLVLAAQRTTERRRTALASQLMRGADQFVVPGTGVIDDFGQTAWDLPTHLHRWVQAAKQNDTPTSFISVGVSSIRQSNCLPLFRSSLQEAAYVSYRDPVSAANAVQSGLGEAFSVVPDLAFSLPRSLLPPPRVTSGRFVVAFGLMGYSGWNADAREGKEIYRRYIDKAIGLATELARLNFRVVLITGDGRNDCQAINDVLSGCAGKEYNSSISAPEILEFQDVLKAIGSADIVVASRFHNVLFGLMLGRPTVSIGYSDKNNAVMSMFARDHLCHDIDTFQTAEVVDNVMKIADDMAVARSGLAQQAERIRQEVDRQFDSLSANWGAS